MKKIVICLSAICLLFLAGGCEKVSEGNYKEGTYYGHVTDTYGGQENEATATIYVDESGMIKSVFLDTTYPTDNGSTTKKSLGNDYNMKTYSNATLEWYEQVKLLEDKVVSSQGIDFINWTDEEQTTTDSVSGVTIKIDALYKALQEALNQAKK